MKYLVLISILFMHSCASLAPVSEDIKEILNNDAVTVKVDKDAFMYNSNVSVKVEVENHEVKPSP